MIVFVALFPCIWKAVFIPVALLFINNQLLELFTFIAVEDVLDTKPKEFKVPVFTLLILNMETPPIVINGVPVKPG